MFVHSSLRVRVYSINNLCVPGTVLGAGDTGMNETGRVPALMRLIPSERETVSHRTNEESRSDQSIKCYEEKRMVNLDSILKNERHHLANKGPYSQSYGFSSSHVWM